MEVHRELGCGFLEAVYQEALYLELATRQIPYQREIKLPIFYKRQKLTCDYRADLICFDSIVVELKALSDLSSIHEAQVINYLKATKYDIGLLINFGAKSLEYKRYIVSNKSQNFTS
jgi:GxxExxY protein